MKMLLIYNPHSGKEQFKTKLNEIINLYTKEGYTLTVHPTQSAKDATAFVLAEGSNYDKIVCSGGDGTLSEILNGLMPLSVRPTVGYIPSGTTNDFAASLCLSKDMMTAAQDVITATPFACDVGTFNQRAFAYIAAFGLFTDVSYQTPQEYKNLLGKMAYLLEGAKRLGSIPSYRLTITTETETFTDDYIYGMVTNSTSVGGFKPAKEQNILLDDGLFEGVFAKRPKGPAETHALLQCVLSATPDPAYLQTFRTRKIEIESAEPLDWTLDGEYGGTTTRATIENHKQAIRIMANLTQTS